MKVIILCGGFGSRLREETESRPKPMVEIGGRPILWHIMRTFAHYGHKEFILCLGYKGEVIKNYFLNYEPFNTDFSIDLKTGKDRWTSSKRFGYYWSMVAQGDRLLGLDGDGMLYLLRANPSEFEELDSIQVSDSTTWGHLAVAGNEIFIRELSGLKAYQWR